MKKEKLLHDITHHRQLTAAAESEAIDCSENGFGVLRDSSPVSQEVSSGNLGVVEREHLFDISSGSESAATTSDNYSADRLVSVKFVKSLRNFEHKSVAESV